SALGAWPTTLPSIALPPSGAAPAMPALPFDPRTIPLPQGFSLPGLAQPAPAAPNPTPAASDRPASWAAMEADLFAEINARRAVGGVCPGSSHVFPPTPPLALHDGLVKAARVHSQDMATRNYFEHESPDGERPGPRSRRYGYTGVFTGENIEMGSPTAAAAVANWMSSAEGHCMNILDERYHYFGGGFAVGAAPYWTADFGP
ncbi:MAG TPA: CAP domain-containing protein, partial [Minicystis sp.]|nr:CAP domain-containing protein [Minicystis sp.]